MPFKKWIAGAISYFIITSDLYLNDFIYELIGKSFKKLIEIYKSLM